MSKNKSFIDNDEILFRAVGASDYKVEADGKCRLSSQAFRDSRKEPSVNRAKLHNNDPTRTQFSEKDGVVSLLTEEVRTEKVKEYSLDAEHAPSNKNQAHSVVIGKPAYKGNDFRKVIERLAILAGKRGWIIFPKHH